MIRVEGYRGFLLVSYIALSADSKYQLAQHLHTNDCRVPVDYQNRPGGKPHLDGLIERPDFESVCMEAKFIIDNRYGPGASVEVGDVWLRTEDNAGF
jgi:hypothetical protein